MDENQNMNNGQQTYGDQQYNGGQQTYGNPQYSQNNWTPQEHGSGFGSFSAICY